MYKGGNCSSLVDHVIRGQGGLPPTCTVLCSHFCSSVSRVVTSSVKAIKLPESICRAQQSTPHAVSHSPLLVHTALMPVARTHRLDPLEPAAEPPIPGPPPQVVEPV
jgi:hypothetical protein